MNDLFKALVYGKHVSLSVLDTTDLVNKAIKIHSLTPPSAVLLGNLLTCCAYMSGCLKSERGAVSITVKSRDGNGSASVSGDVSLHIRGYAEGSCRDSLKGGVLTVIKDDGFFRPFVGACEIECDDVSRILTDYFLQSEQIPTAVSVGVKLNEDGSCAAAGGVVMQLMPGCPQERFFKDEIDQNGLYLLHPDYICNCSRAKIEDVIRSVGRAELLNICAEQGRVSVHCHYCNTDYTFDKDDIEKLFDNE